MKIKPTDEVKVKVQAQSYQKGGVSTKTYSGSWEKVLIKISSVHSYGWVVGVDEDGDVLSCDDVLKSIYDANGDGCDEIFNMTVKKGKRSYPLIESDPFDEEDIDCD